MLHKYIISICAPGHYQNGRIIDLVQLNRPIDCEVLWRAYEQAGFKIEELGYMNWDKYGKDWYIKRGYK